MIRCFYILVVALFIAQPFVFAQQDNLQRLIDQVEDGKTYVLRKADKPGPKTVSEDKGYYIRIVPPRFKMVKDTIELSPALNGNLDTSNYFIQTEVLVLKEQVVDWRLAKVSELCMQDKQAPHAALCLVKTAPTYQLVNRKFFPFKNILDTTNTDFVIPAKIIIVERQELLSPPTLERLPLSPQPTTQPGEKLIRVNPGLWLEWEEVVCPFGLFNTPEMREVQQALVKQGYKINITGDFDEPTKRALHEYQKDNMLEVGALDESTIQRLGIKRAPLIEIIND